ncbi:MAG: 50S ribosomal protein P1 [Candidatus Nitrosothermus koennekii]|nr:MAG: 50S ribosomal protein P1 [Candidatus Nitrosothermus koennekii]
MEYVYAALLLHKLKQEINEDNIKNVVKATGVEPDEVKVKALVAALSEVDIDEALKSAPVAVAAPAAAPSEAPGEAKAEEKKEEGEEEEKKGEEEAMAGLSALFG